MRMQRAFLNTVLSWGQKALAGHSIRTCCKGPRCWGLPLCNMVVSHNTLCLRLPDVAAQLKMNKATHKCEDSKASLVMDTFRLSKASWKQSASGRLTSADREVLKAVEKFLIGAAPPWSPVASLALLHFSFNSGLPLAFLRCTFILILCKDTPDANEVST